MSDSSRADTPSEDEGLDSAEPPDAPGDRIEYMRLAPEETAARHRRNQAIALGLVIFIVLVFLVTVLRLSGNQGGVM